MTIATPLNAPTAKRPPKVIKIRDGIDVTATYFVYRLYDIGGQPTQWHVVHGMGESAAIISRAVERGCIIAEGTIGKPLELKAALTDEGRQPCA